MTTYADLILAKSPTVYLRLGDGTVTFADSSGNANAFTPGGAAWVRGYLPGLLVGDSNPCVHITDISSAGHAWRTAGAWSNPAGPWTMSIIVKPTNRASARDWYTILRREDGVNPFWVALQWISGNTYRVRVLWGSAGVLRELLSSVTFDITTSPKLHLTLTHDGTTMVLYVNGAAAGSVASPPVTWAGTPTLGTWAPGNYTYPFTGWLDEFALFPSALSAADAAVLNDGMAGTFPVLTPPTPTGVAADPDLTSVALSWAASAGATGYDVRVNGGTPAAVGNLTAYTVTGLSPATAYTLEVRATNGSGPSAWASITTTTDTPPAPPAPTGLAVVPGPEELAFTWAASAGATGYDVRRDYGPATAVGNVTAHDFTGLPAYTAHTLQVRATNLGGASEWATLEAVTEHYPPAAYTAAVLLEIGPEDAPIDVTGSTRTITTRTGLTADGPVNALEPGFLTATVTDPGVSPVTSEWARPGRPLRLSVRYGDTWLRVWTGTITRARLQLRPKEDPAEYAVVFEAADVVATLATLPALTAVGGSFRQRVEHVLAGTSVAYAVTDTGADDPSPPALPTDATTALGQLVLARDTAHGVIHVDAYNVLRCYADRDRPSTITVATFSDGEIPAAPGVVFYTHLEPDFDTADLLNVVEVTTVGAEAPAVYTDEDSRTEWGPAYGALVVNEGDPEDHAVRYLAGRTTPALAVKRLQYNVTDRTSDAALVGVNDAVRTVRAGLLDAPAQVLAVEHTITATRWTVSLTCRQLETLPIRWIDVPAGLTWADVPAGLTWNDAVDWRP